MEGFIEQLGEYIIAQLGDMSVWVFIVIYIAVITWKMISNNQKIKDRIFLYNITPNNNDLEKKMVEKVFKMFSFISIFLVLLAIITAISINVIAYIISNKNNDTFITINRLVGLLSIFYIIYDFILIVYMNFKYIKDSKNKNKINICLLIIASCIIITYIDTIYNKSWIITLIPYLVIFCTFIYILSITTFSRKFPSRVVVRLQEGKTWECRYSDFKITSEYIYIKKRSRRNKVTKIEVHKIDEVVGWEYKYNKKK